MSEKITQHFSVFEVKMTQHFSVFEVKMTLAAYGSGDSGLELLSVIFLRVVIAMTMIV